MSVSSPIFAFRYNASGSDFDAPSGHVGLVNYIGTTNEQSSYTWTPPPGWANVEVLVVAGGGGGGDLDYRYGGGGAGGVTHNFGTIGFPVASQYYNILVGRGGIQFEQGYDSAFHNILAKGGGRGGGASSGGVGGSGGGGGAVSGALGGIASQPGKNLISFFDFGNNGGNNGSAGGGGNQAGAGGGGAGGLGSNSFVSGPNGNGGSGIYLDTLSPYGDQGWFGGGGGGSGALTSPAGIGGIGGGGNGGTGFNNETGQNALPHTGGGGGGSAWNSVGLPGGNGGSGIVIIRFYKGVQFSSEGPLSFSSIRSLTRGTDSIGTISYSETSNKLFGGINNNSLVGITGQLSLTTFLDRKFTPAYDNRWIYLPIERLVIDYQLVLYLKDMIGSTWLDMLGNQNNAYYIGGAETTPYYGGGFVTPPSQVSKYVLLPEVALQNLPNGSYWTLSWWFVILSHSGVRYCMSMANPSFDNVFITEITSNTIRLWSATLDSGYETIWEINTPMFITVARQNTTFAIYKNGILNGTYSFSTSFENSTTTGWLLNQEQDFVKGGFDSNQNTHASWFEVLLYSRALTNTEIMQEYTRTSLRFFPQV